MGSRYWRMQSARHCMQILVVEDSAEDALLIKAAIGRIGIGVSLHIVEDGVEAVRYLRGDGKYRDRREFPSPTIVVSDVKMPHMDGIQFLRWVRSHPDCAGIPIIIFTSSDAPSEAEQAYRLGANAYLVKPSTLKEFTELLRATCEFWSRCVPVSASRADSSAVFQSQSVHPSVSSSHFHSKRIP